MSYVSKWTKGGIKIQFINFYYEHIRFSANHIHFEGKFLFNDNTICFIKVSHFGVLKLAQTLI